MMVVTFVVTVITSAGIFEKITGGALRQINIEFDRLHSLSLAAFKHQDDGDEVSLRQFFLRKKSVLGLLKGEFCRLGAIASDRLHTGGIRWLRLPFIIQEGDARTYDLDVQLLVVHADDRATTRSTALNSSSLRPE